MEEDIQFGILRIGSDLVELQEDQHETETSLPVFHPKSFSANWFNQVNDDPNLFNPSNKRDLDQFISLKMRKADYAFSIGNYYQCIQEIETLRSFVPVIKKMFQLSSNMVVALCHYHLDSLSEAEMAVKTCLNYCDANEDFTSCIVMWRKLVGKANKKLLFLLDLIAIHFDPQNFFTLFNIAKCENCELLSSFHAQNSNFIRLRLLLRVKYLTHSAITNNRSFFARRYVKIHESAKKSIDDIVVDDCSQPLGDVLAEAERMERSVGSFFTPCKLPTQALMKLFDKDVDFPCDEVELILKSFARNYLSFN